MTKSLGDLLVVSDLDGTLLTSSEGLPGCNAAMIRLFSALGGRFTVATGRSPASARRALDGLPLGAPAIVFNGGMLYDYEKGVVAAEHFLPRQTALDAIRALTAQAPEVGVEVLADNGRMYLPACGAVVQRHAVREGLPYVAAQLEDIPGRWYKVLFGAPPAVLSSLEQFAAGLEWEGAYFTATSPTYLELMPQGVDKGSALRELCALIGVAAENVIAVGDYYNDIGMLRAAGHPVAVGNAAPQVKLLCEGEVLPCRDGGVAQLLYELIRRYER